MDGFLMNDHADLARSVRSSEQLHVHPDLHDLVTPL